MNSKRTFSIGELQIGGNAPIIVQSMTNTNTLDVSATAQQCQRMVDSGAQMVRITVPSLKEIDALKLIKSELTNNGYNKIPLVADVHFNPKVAEEAAKIVQKVRINPGNFTDKRNFSVLDLTDAEYNASVERMAQRAKPLFDICKQYDTAIRIGINHGSLCDRIVSRYGNTPEAMVESAIEWLQICENYSFHKIVLSMKSSNVLTMLKATTLLHERMQQLDLDFPLHLGVTEAGNGIEGRVKSASGIGALLLSGIGDTIRVSLTENPENESPFAHTLISAIQNLDVNSLNIKDKVLFFEDSESNFERWLCRAAAVSAFAHFNCQLTDIHLVNKYFSNQDISNLKSIILQACRIRIENTEFVACPSCGRTQYDIQSVFKKVKTRFAGHPNLKIGVMGCIVNGPGEMADADFGIVGATNGLVCVYEGKKRISKPLEVGEALNLLENIINNSFDK